MPTVDHFSALTWILTVTEPVPPLDLTSLVTQTRLDNWLAATILLAAALYLYGVNRLRVRGDQWPVARTVSFVLVGLGSMAAVTLTGVGAYDTNVLSVHMVQHMVLSMVSPIFMAVGAPVTLALRTLPKAPRGVLLKVLHSRYVAVISHPLVAFAVFVVNPFALYFTDWYELTLRDQFWHEFMHVHFIVSGSLFFWPLVGRDPLPSRWPYPGRALLMMLSVPFHTVLGLTIMQQRTLVAGDYYPSLAQSWLDPAADQVVAGGVLWAGGEFVSVTMLAVLLTQWVKQSRSEAARIDRKLDREEALAAAVAALAAASGESTDRPAADPPRTTSHRPHLP